MNVTAAINVPNVDQTSIWKGYYEAHFMSGKEIDIKYPILNNKWKYSHHKLLDGYDGCYYFEVNKSFNVDCKASPLRFFPIILPSLSIR